VLKTYATVATMKDWLDLTQPLSPEWSFPGTFELQKLLHPDIDEESFRKASEDRNRRNRNWNCASKPCALGNAMVKSVPVRANPNLPQGRLKRGGMAQSRDRLKLYARLSTSLLLQSHH
jgi:hypothetical protein